MTQVFVPFRAVSRRWSRNARVAQGLGTLVATGVARTGEIDG